MSTSDTDTEGQFSLPSLVNGTERPVVKNAFNQRERAVEAVRLLDYFLMDLITGTRILGIFESPALASKITPHMGVALNRVAISHLIVTLSKWTEFYQR
jgi:hypothetical protein